MKIIKRECTSKYLVFCILFALLLLFEGMILMSYDISYAKEDKSDNLVGINELQNYASLKCDCSDSEFQAAYDAARAIVDPLVGKSRLNQVKGVTEGIRNMLDNGQVSYTMNQAHYNDPYGYFCLGVGSCAGATRATGLCLNMLGIPYEHVHENQFCHQWVRVKVGDEYWIADAFGLTLGPEPQPYMHPHKQ